MSQRAPAVGTDILGVTSTGLEAGQGEARKTAHSQSGPQVGGQILANHRIAAISGDTAIPSRSDFRIDEIEHDLAQMRRAWVFEEISPVPSAERHQVTLAGMASRSYRPISIPGSRNMNMMNGARIREDGATARRPGRLSLTRC